MRVGVIVVAAGLGTRMGGPVPKQLLDLGGRTILRRSLATFDSHPGVVQIVVVLHESLVPNGAEVVGTLSRPHAIVAGGARRQDSVACGMSAVAEDVDVVLVHDAARPFASHELVDRVIDAAAACGAAIPGLAVRDTVKRVDPSTKLITATIPRDEVWLAQTPQGFRREVLANAIAKGSGSDATDEAVLAERAGQRVRIVEGETGNMKITTPDDLAAAREQVGQGGEVRVGTGYDLHRLDEGRPLVLAGVTIPFDRGPVAHSDGDVLSHALIDALLGAAGAGDIGRHFPNTDASWKNAAGLDLLNRTMTILDRLGWLVVNADVTIVLERPKLAPHVDAIRERAANALRVPVDRISVKGKTNEGVDAVGKGEAIAAHAVVMLSRAERRR